MKILFVWTGFSSYMADCWRTLVGRDDVEVRVWVEQVRGGNIAFKPDTLMRGIPFDWHYSDEVTADVCRRVESEMVAFGPDVIFVCGWARHLPPFVAKSARLRSVPKVLCCDMPWEWTLRKFAARFVLWRHLRRFRKVMVPGRRGAKYGRWLGFSKADVLCGEYGIDTARFVQTNPNRRGFISIGRLVEEKNIPMLVEAYRQYRRLGGCWGLDVYGMGDEARHLQGVEGVCLHGFTQPEEIPDIMAKAGAFVLASRWDPWPLVILESCAAGLPVICTERCWNHYELMRENGTVVPSSDASAMAQAMLAWERDPNRIERGETGRKLAADYSCAKWAERVIACGKALTGK